MAIKSHFSTGRMTWWIENRFDFSSHDEFERLMEAFVALPDCKRLSVDLSRVTYIDSSAIGMLLVLLGRASGVGKDDISLHGANGMIRQILNVAHLDRKFKIE